MAAAAAANSGDAAAANSGDAPVQEQMQ